MIDTLNFRLNNVTKYPLTRTQYEATTSTGETHVVVDENTGEVADNRKIRAILHHDSDSLIPLSKRSTIYIKSSHYSVSYFYNITQDFIDFNLSIPKYLYGTNIIQFVKYFSQDCNTTYDALVDFVKSFVHKHFIDVIDMKDIELTRLDLCYNQFFNSKFDAMKYLLEQKELLTKHARSTKNDYRNYDSSFMYITKRYSFKVYHKGTEFFKNDRKELIKKNPTGHGVDELKEISDKILRYEVTFRKAQINYLFEQKECHLPYVKFLQNESARKSFRLLNRDLYDRSIEFCEQGKHFVFAPISQDEAIRTQTVSFDRIIFAHMFNFFWDTVKKYQLKQRLSVYDVVKKVDDLNKKRDQATSKALRAKLSYNKPMIVALATLTQYESIDALRKSGLFSKPTFYRYQKKLKDLGIDSEARLTDMPPPTLDYVDYKYYFGRHHIK
ncbi:MAG: phage/plasmid replication protein [Bacteroidota bacterium]